MIETKMMIHDLNNILTVITGTAELLKMKLNNGGADYGVLRNINTLLLSSEKAAKMIKNYGSNKEEQTINLAKYLDNLKDIITASGGQSIEYGFNLADAGHIYMNSADLDEIALNLVKNAIEAMDGRNLRKLAVSTEKKHVDSLICATCGEKFSGDYSVMEISNTGRSVSNPQHVFDYAYSTRNSSGIGLYVVRVKTHIANGHIMLDTYTSEGAAFKIYFPTVGKTQETEGLPLRGNAVVFAGDGNVFEALQGYLRETGIMTGDKNVPETVDLIIYDGDSDCNSLSDILNRYPFARILCMTEQEIDNSTSKRVYFAAKPTDGTEFISLVKKVLKNNPVKGE